MARALVNLARVLGSCIGGSTASSMMSWQMQRSRGPDPADPSLSGGLALLDAVESSLIMLAAFAPVAVGASLACPGSAPKAGRPG